MSIKFISFGGPSKNYHRAVNRITNEANITKLFTEVKGFTDLDLKNDTEFWSNHGKFLENNRRGYGYWLWKPYLVKKTLDSMKYNDILFYADAGCKFELNKDKSFLIERINHIRKEKKIIGCFTCPEISYNKMDLIKYLGMEDRLPGHQHAATAMMLIKTNEITSLVNEWWRIATLDNYHYIDDTPSKIKNLHHFKDHRHDQSIYSLLTKKYNLYSKLSIRGGSGSFFHTPRYRNGPSFDEINSIPGSKDVTKIICDKFFRENTINLKRIYNHIFSDISFGNKKVLIIEYIDTNNNNQKITFLENRHINLNNVKKINKCIYKKKDNIIDNFSCLVNC